MNEGSRDSALKYLKQGDTIIVGIPSATEYVSTQIVGVYDAVNNSSIIAPTVVDKGVETLYDKTLQLLWDDYNLVKTDDVERKKVLNKINSIKRQDYVYFGMKDLTTGEDMIISMGINHEAGRKDKAGNNFYNAIKKLENKLSKKGLEITKGSMGAWTILPIDLEDLTTEQQLNFQKVKDIPLTTYESVMFKSDAARQEEDIKKFGNFFGFDVTRLGLDGGHSDNDAPQGEGYGF